MKIIRFSDARGDIGFARDHDGNMDRLEGNLESGFRLSGEKARVARVLPAVAPTAIFCIGLNYIKHAVETGARIPRWPVLFMKNPASAAAAGQPVEIPRHLASGQVDYECELAVVIGRRCKNVTRAEALDYVAGYACANDVSARDWQKERGGSQWCRGKSFDTFCPLGPCLVTPDEIPNPNALRIRTILNGEVVQDSNTADMIFDIPTIIEFLSGSTTLHPGSVILTGTPSGVGMACDPPRWLKPGDVMTVEIDKIGSLTNPVILEP